MSRRIKPVAAHGKDYEKRLKEYFCFHLYGLSIEDCGGQVQVQVVYEDFKHIDTVRRELAQMMPEVEFVKIRRDFTHSAEQMVSLRMHDERPSSPGTDHLCEAWE